MSEQWQPRVSLVLACRNEERSITAALKSLLGQYYPRHLVELLVVDGMSNDQTRDRVKAMADDRIRLLDNPERSTPAGFNVGIRAATGEVIFILGAHTRYSANYVSGAVAALARYDADAVGGVVRAEPGDDTSQARAIALALSSRFGVGNSLMRVGTTQPQEADTAAYAGYRRRVFERVGRFNPDLVRNQDIEFNLRLRRAGMRIVVEPAIESFYQARPTLVRLAQNAFANGFWVVYGTRFSCRPFALRHLVPLGFVLACVAGALVLLGGRLFGAAPALVYAAACILAALRATRQDPRAAAWLPAVYPVLHFGYGIGSLVALVRRASSLGDTIRIGGQFGHVPRDSRRRASGTVSVTGVTHES
jgi:glycosyltransferase involved in cell wall biosynthesis